MDPKEFLMKMVRSYFMLVTLILAAITIIGRIYAPDEKISYGMLGDTFQLAALGIIPGIIMYSKKELSVKQVVIRKILQFIVVEAEIMIAMYMSDTIDTGNENVMISVAVSVFAVFAVLNILNLISENITAARLNKDLMEFRSNNE